jgi:hypothetical protein
LEHLIMATSTQILGKPAAVSGNSPILPDEELDFILNPAPRSGQGPYGLVPGSQGLPNPARDLGRRFPGLDQSNAQISQNIMSELQGELPQDVIDAIQDEGARFGITSGMPGSDMARRRSAKNLGLTTLGLQQHGLQDYLGATQGISRTQTVDPALQAQIAAYNAVLNSAPDPSQAVNAMKGAFDSGRGPSGGGGGSVRITPPNLTAPGPFGNPMGAPGQTPIFTGGTRGTGGYGGGGVAPIDTRASAYTTYPGSGSGYTDPFSSYNDAVYSDPFSSYNDAVGVGDYGQDYGPSDPFWDDFWSSWDSSFGDTGGGGGYESDQDVWSSLGL